MCAIVGNVGGKVVLMGPVAGECCGCVRVSLGEVLGIWGSCGMRSVGFVMGAMCCVSGFVFALGGGCRVGWVEWCAGGPCRCSPVPSVAVSWV